VQASFEYNRVRVRETKLCHGKNSATIALGIELGVLDNDLGDMYRLIVQVNFRTLILKCKTKLIGDISSFALQFKNQQILMRLEV